VPNSAEVNLLFNKFVELDHYVRGIGNKFQWRDVLKTIEDEEEAPKTETPTPEAMDVRPH
jgi:hypothetical protein